MNTNRLYVDIHALQTVPPSCLNRDDTGSPKTALYGGVVRSRVSSQCWKRAIRTMFHDELFPENMVGVRTKKIASLVAKEIEALDPSQNAPELAEKALKMAGLAKIKADEEADSLFFLSMAQAQALAKLVVNGIDEKRAYVEALKYQPSVDMALFGRMVASVPSLSYDAAAQVAHSISTHMVQNEYDFFTAVDDCRSEDQNGSAYLDTVEYNSSTLYRYATVNVLELASMLGSEETPHAVQAFVEAFIRSMPTGKQNSFANRTLPDVVYITLRKDQPVNLCCAFENPVTEAGNGYMEPSKKRLVEYADQLYHTYISEPEKAFVIGAGIDELGESIPMKNALDQLETAVRGALALSEV